MLDTLLSSSFLSVSRNNDESILQKSEFSLSNGTQVTIHGPGVIEFEPVDAGHRSLVYSCGVHGNETAPIEICDDFVQAILAEKCVLAHRLLVIFGNLPAMDNGTRFIEENMNRLFCGAHSEGHIINAERQRASFLENCIEGFYLRDVPNAVRHHYDLHTAIRASKNEKFAVYPFLHDRKYSIEQLRFMAACGVKTILLSQSSTTTFSYFSSKTFGAHAFTVELGKVRPFGQNDRTQFADAENALIKLATEHSYSADENIDDMLIYNVNQVVNKTEEDFVLTFDDDTPNFTDYRKGTVLAKQTGTEFVAEYDGEAIVFPNANVAIGQRALLTVVPVSLESLPCSN